MLGSPQLFESPPLVLDRVMSLQVTQHQPLPEDHCMRAAEN